MSTLAHPNDVLASVFDIHIPTSPRERAEWEKKIRAAQFIGPQQRWLDDKSRLKIAEKCRQVGFSWTDALDSLFETASVDWPFDCWVSSRDQIQAQLYGQDVAMWAKRVNLAAGELGESVLEDADGKKISALRLPLANGRSIWSLSSNVDAQAGKRGTRKMDEFALNPQNRQLGENTPLEKVETWLELVKSVTGNSRGALPPGATIEALDLGNLDGVQFKNFIDAEDSDLVLAGTSGLLTMLTASTGLGDNSQGDNHEESFDALAIAEAAEVSALLQQQHDKPILRQEFPSQPPVAYFELCAQDVEDLDALADRLVKLKQAGFVALAKQLSEKFGIELEAAPEPAAAPRGADPSAPSDRSAPPLKNRAAVDAGGAVFRRNSLRDLTEAEQEAVAPLLDRVAALKDVPDAELGAALLRLQADVPRLLAEARLQQPDIADVWEQVFAAALVDGLADRPQAEKPALNAANPPGGVSQPSPGRQNPA